MNWTDGFKGAITVCDCEGIVVYMNDESKRIFAKYAQDSLVGKSLLFCHPEPARTKLMEMMVEPCSNTYTIEKNGIRKMIHQTPWMEDGQFKGVVEMSFEIPMEMSHHSRD